MAPELPLAQGAYQAKIGSEEHELLEKQAHEDGKFAVMRDENRQTDIFVPYEGDPQRASAAYTMEVGGTTFVDLIYIPEQFAERSSAPARAEETVQGKRTVIQGLKKVIFGKGN